MNVVLVEPEIPPNTGSIARLCAATLTTLHLVAPLGFKIDDKHLKRAGLDYWEYVDLRLHDSWEDFVKEHAQKRLLFFFQKSFAILHESSLCRRYFSGLWTGDSRTFSGTA